MKKLCRIVSCVLVPALLLCSCGTHVQPASPAPDSDIVVSTAPIRQLQAPAASRPVTAVPVSEEMTVQEGRAAFLSTGSLDDVKLNLPTTFRITRPAEKLTTTYAKYFITGTSDPGLPVYYNGQEIERLGEKGAFGVLVDLAIGANTFTFAQGGKDIPVTITRKEEPAAGTPITVLRQSSLYPAAAGGVKAGGEITAECVGPSGASVTASFGGASVKLEQVAQADKGVPAVFRAKLPVGTGYDADTTKKIGKITYTMTYDGATQEYQSTGDMYVAGKNSAIAVRVSTYIGIMYPDYKAIYTLGERLKQGATDTVVSDNNEYFQLSSGGWLPKAMAEIIEGKVDIRNKLAEISSTVYNNCEIYSFAGTETPAYRMSFADNVFKLTLYNTTGSQKPDISKSKLFSGVTAEGEDNSATQSSSVTYSFAVSNPGLLWGYGVSYDGTTLQLRVRYKPTGGSAGAPLTGVTVLVDPGHGGREPGAAGVAGDTGSWEKDINLAVGYATRDALQALGATVLMTRDGDTTISLDDRLKVIEITDADFFLSVHHNSLNETVDANKVAGMEMYYYTASSKPFAESIMESMATSINRSNRGVQEGAYRVTLMNYAPAILAECGYLSNPLEYERILDRGEIIKVGKALAQGVVRALK